MKMLVVKELCANIVIMADLPKRFHPKFRNTNLKSATYRV